MCHAFCQVLLEMSHTHSFNNVCVCAFLPQQSSMEYLWQKWQIPQNLTYLLSSSIPNKNKIQMYCMKSVLVSVTIALINGLNKNKLGEEGFILVHKSKSKYITRGSPSGISLRASHNKSVRKELREWMLPCFYSELTLYSCTSDSKCREWCCPQSVRLPTSSSQMKAMFLKTCPQASQSTLYFIVTLFADSSSLYQAKN